MERVSLILVMLTLHSDSNFKRSNITFKENKLDDINPNTNGFSNVFERKKEEIYGFRQTALLYFHLPFGSSKLTNGIYYMRRLL